METLILKVTGMACGGCSNTVQQALLALEGVVDAEVSHVEARAVVTFDPQKLSLAQLEETIRAAGYTAVAV